MVQREVSFNFMETVMSDQEDGTMPDNVVPIKPESLEGENVRGDFETDDNGRPVVDSRTVAARFGKSHFNVLQSIDALISQEPGVALNFQANSYVAENGKRNRCFRLDRRGFSLLAMGFTGAEAIKWKLKYIDTFDAMEARIKSGGFDPSKLSRLEILRMAVESEERAEKEAALRLAEEAAHNSTKKQVVDLKGHVRELKPKAVGYDRIRKSEGGFCITDAAKMLKPRDSGKTFGPRKLFDTLREKGWLWQKANRPTETAQKNGWLFEAPFEYQPEKFRNQTYMTWKGLTEIAKISGCDLVYSDQLDLFGTD